MKMDAGSPLERRRCKHKRTSVSRLALIDHQMREARRKNEAVAAEVVEHDEQQGRGRAIGRPVHRIGRRAEYRRVVGMRDRLLARAGPACAQPYGKAEEYGNSHQSHNACWPDEASMRGGNPRLLMCVFAT
jgi:hypothetical protein